MTEGAGTCAGAGAGAVLLPPLLLLTSRLAGPCSSSRRCGSSGGS